MAGTFGVELRRVRTSAQVVPVGEMRAFLHFLGRTGLRVTSVLDVGANRGAWAQLVLEAFSSAEVFMIEPQIEMKRYLDDLCARNPRCQWLLAGAGPVNGESVLVVRDDFIGTSFILPDAAEGERRAVPVVTIDSLLAQGRMRLPELVKIDVQGFELEVLRGAQRLFGETELFILEASFYESIAGRPLFADVVEFMRARGYLVYDFAGFLRRPLDGALGQADVCFARKAGYLRRVESW